MSSFSPLLATFRRRGAIAVRKRRRPHGSAHSLLGGFAHEAVRVLPDQEHYVGVIGRVGNADAPGISLYSSEDRSRLRKSSLNTGYIMRMGRSRSRAEERRVGKECVRKFRIRWSP